MRAREAKGSSVDEARWQAVLARDASADGSFFYSVATTGVYCRPSCPARKPLRKNVRFYATCAEAEKTGFRPCKRCHPNTDAPARLQAAMIEKVCRMIEAAETAPTLVELAREAGMSPYHFHRLFKAATGVTPKAYSVAQRSKRVRDALQGDKPVTRAIYESGFNSSGRFYDHANRMLGMTPRAFRAGGADMQIRHATAMSSLGLVLVGATDSGVCAILFGDDEAALERELHEHFPRATLTEGGAEFAELLAQVVASIEMPEKAAALPIDIRGTAFQQRVWAALRDIPPGETASYAEIARRIGHPTAVRAVGTACGANPIAVAVPCHRVVGSGGQLTGYRWGIERKRTLIARERK